MRTSDWSSDVCSSDLTLVFPCVKLGLLAIIWTEREHNLTRVRRLHQRVEYLGKWSMLDVFVVAILIVAMKSAAVAEIHRSEERRVGKECVSTCRSRGSPSP